jgi:hypothetical protein
MTPQRAPQFKAEVRFFRRNLPALPDPRGCT